jgi:hypothetical protein
MPKNIKSLKIRKNGTMKLSRTYTDATISTGTPGKAGEIDPSTDKIILALGVSSGKMKGLIVEQTTLGEDQGKISILADEAEVTVENASLASGVQFTIGGAVYHNSAALLTPTSGTGNRMGTSLASLYSNSGSDLDMLTRSAEDIARNNA